MGKYLLVKKLAIMIGACMIVVAVLVFLVTQTGNYLGYLEMRQHDWGPTNSYIQMFMPPFAHLISGVGFGGILILLALMFDPEKASALEQKEEPALETDQFPTD